MTRRSFRSDSPPRLRANPLLLTSALALVLSALPVSISSETPTWHWQSALARGGPGGGGPGGGSHGGGGGAGGLGADPGAYGRDNAKQGHAYGREQNGSDGRGHAGGVGSYSDVTEFLDSVRSGRAFGLERRDERMAAARERYQALDNPGKHAGQDLASHQIGAIAHHFAAEDARALIERGWKGPTARDDGFRNHGERVRTMVELAKQLGYSAHVGALQANFGTPYENGIAALQDQLAAAETAGDEAEVERLEAELADAIANAKPGVGPDDSWATADLDVNDDGVVDRQDLEALEQTADDQSSAG